MGRKVKFFSIALCCMCAFFTLFGCTNKVKEQESSTSLISTSSADKEIEEQAPTEVSTSITPTSSADNEIDEQEPTDFCIKYLYFVSFAENDGHENCLLIDTDEERTLLKNGLSSDAARALVQEVYSLKNVSESDEQQSFIIRITYVRDGIEKQVERKGYFDFPENWEEIISLTNEATEGYMPLSNSQSILRIDDSYIRQHYEIDESVLQDGVTLEDVISNMPITYMTLYDPENILDSSGVQSLIEEYVASYTELQKYHVSDLKLATEYEMYVYATNCLEHVESDGGEYCLRGTYHDETYRIILYDEIDTWLEEQESRWDDCGFELSQDGYLVYHSTLQQADGGTFNQPQPDQYVYVDATGRFLILTTSKNPTDIAKVIGIIA